MAACVATGAVVLAGCGHGTQRAAVSAVGAGATGSEADASEKDAPEYLVDTARSRFEVWGTDILSGEHRITFPRWQARVRKTRRPEIHAEVDMCSAEIDMTSALGVLRHKLLECDRFPTGTLDATMTPLTTGGAKPNEQLVEGIQELHGVRKKLRFTGFLTQEAAPAGSPSAEPHYRFVAAFVIARTTFGIRYGPAEPFLKDDVRVVIDVVAVPAAAQPAAQPTEGAGESKAPTEEPFDWMPADGR